MSRQKEALKTIKKIGNLPDAITEEANNRLFKACVTGLLCDISLSLAVIADKLTVIAEEGRKGEDD